MDDVVPLVLIICFSARCRYMYFLLLMAAGFGLFVSEEALNVWVRLSYWYNVKDNPYSLKHMHLLSCR